MKKENTTPAPDYSGTMNCHICNYYTPEKGCKHYQPEEKNMKKETTITAPDYSGTIEKLKAFVEQRPGFEFVNYGSMKYYKADYSKALKDKNSFYEILALAQNFVTYSELQETLFIYLKRNSGRLTLDENNNLQYCVGQYFPTEYRAAACRILAGLVWDIVRDQYPKFTGTEIRKFITKRLITKNSKLYFN